MNRKTFFFLPMLLAALVAGASSQALAAPLPAGGVQFPAAVAPAPAGALVIVASQFSPFSTPTFDGLLASFAISGDVTNPHGGLTFLYLLGNAASSSDAIGRLALDGFSGFLTDVGYDATPVGVPAPFSIDRDPAGGVIGATFAPNGIDPKSGFLIPGFSATPIIIRTDAPDWTMSLGSVIDGSVATVDIVAPNVPEPSTLALAGLGLVGLGVQCVRRRRK